MIFHFNFAYCAQNSQVYEIISCAKSLEILDNYTFRFHIYEETLIITKKWVAALSSFFRLLYGMFHLLQ